MSNKVVYARTPLGQELYDLMQLIKLLPKHDGEARQQQLTRVVDQWKAFEDKWHRDPGDLIAWLCE